MIPARPIQVNDTLFQHVNAKQYSDLTRPVLPLLEDDLVIFIVIKGELI
jgi:hypothetical protein